MRKILLLLLIMTGTFMGFSQQSSYCGGEVRHLGIPAEVLSGVFLTIENVDATTMRVEIESANNDSIDLLLITNGSGAMLSAQDSSEAGKIKQTLSWMTPPDSVQLNVLWSKRSFGGNWQLNPTDIKIPFLAACSATPSAQVDLPITFDDTATVNYDLADFGGNISQIVVDPTNASNLVVESVKDSTAQLWAGTTAGGTGLASAIPFAAGSTSMTVRVWSPDANIPIRLKVEDASNAAISVETEAMTTMAMAWETLTFDFSNNVSGTPAINFANTYDKVSIFFNFGTDGATAGRKTYYWDDVMFVQGTVMKTAPDLPITFEDTATVDYDLTDFGGNISQIVVDPTNASNLVAESIKDSTAQLWAGTTAGDAGLVTPLPFAAGSTSMTVRVWSPDANIPVRLKVEDAANGAISVETEAMTTMAMAWETLTFDFSNNVSGTPAINFANTYNKVSIFFNFGTDGATAGRKTYYWDDVMFSSGTAMKTAPDLPITFEDTATVDYDLTDFGGNISQIVVDPTNASNLVAESIKDSTAQLWAGTTAGDAGLVTPLPFAAGSTSMTVRVWSPDANIPVRLKVEDAANGAISVETEAMTTMAMAWETLTFDFSNNV
ncbi:MAG: hypothetical protein MRZ79_07565, partial [Bacteroidia bacterium]|nr:hypothetical protein [Bacteroidia bacterium]